MWGFLRKFPPPFEVPSPLGSGLMRIIQIDVAFRSEHGRIRVPSKPKSCCSQLGCAPRFDRLGTLSPNPFRCSGTLMSWRTKK